MVNRINLILQAKNLSPRQFAEEIGIQPSGMSHILGGRNNPSLEFAVKVLRRFPEIDANWLLMGRGQMYASPAGAPSAAAAAPLPAAEPDFTLPEVQEPTLFVTTMQQVDLDDAEPPAEMPAAAGQGHAPAATGEAEPVQEHGLPAGWPCAPVPHGAAVARVMLFYADGTFESFSPRA